jgi:CHAT domain-containing protein
VNDYKAEEGLYREAQETERATIIANAIATIEEATTQAAVEETAAAAITAIDALKTDAELTAEEKDAADKVLAGEKEEALEKINEIKASVDYAKYSAENQAKINNLYKTAKDLVEDALSSSEIEAAVAAFETEIKKVPQTEAVDTDNNDSTTPDADNSGAMNNLLAQFGCASVVGVSGVMALTIALGAALCVKKRKED